MFTQLTLRNFKAWRERIEIPLAPVTVLLGTNSSGKSSLLQALLLMKQTALSPDRSIHLNFGGEDANDYFNFGDFEDVLTRGVKPRHFEIGFSLTSNSWRDISGVYKRVNGEFNASYGITSHGVVVIQELKLGGANYYGRNANIFELAGVSEDTPIHTIHLPISDLEAEVPVWEPSPENSNIFKVLRREKGAYSIYVDDESQSRGKSEEYSPERSIAFPPRAIYLLDRDAALAEDISFAIRRELTSIAYLGPLRRKPERDYVWNKTKPGELGTDGAGFVNALFDSTFYRSKNGDPVEIVEEVSSWLARMGVAERLEARQVGRSSRYEIVVHKDGVVANLRDVGIGISQVLPVLTLAFFAQEGSTILMEEPEIHLHPLAQSVLAELFVEVSRKRRVQFIVETHSEHLFRRLQTLVAKEELSLDDCRMYFVERQGADAVLKNLEPDEYGRVTRWPDKFFGDTLGETREQARLMFERQKRERQA